MIASNGPIARPTWNPAQLAGVTPTLQLSPRLSSIAQGAEVDSIANLGSAGSTATQSTSSLRPLMRREVGGAAGRNALDFDGSDDRMTGPSASAIFGSGSWSILAIVTLDGLVASSSDPWRDAAPLGDSGGYVALTVRDSAGTPQVGAYRFRSGTQAVYATCQGVGARQILIASYNHATGELLAQCNDGAPSSNIGALATTTGGTAQLGGFGPTYLNGRIFELVAWQAALEATARARLVRVARRCFGVP